MRTTRNHHDRSQKLVPQVGGMPFMTGNNYVDLIVTMSPKVRTSDFTHHPHHHIIHLATD